MTQNKLEKYARLLVKTGINIQKGQTLVINSPIETAEFARMIAEHAYDVGAREVVMRWSDELSTKMKYLHADDEVFDEFPDWAKEFSLSYSRKGAAFLSISASDPELMKDVDPNRMARQQKVASSALKEYRERMMSNKNTWCIASVPTAAWAKKVFPDVSEDEAVERLWDAIFKAIRVDKENPVAAWEEHKRNLKNSMEFLNNHNLKSLQFRNDLGTDLEVELPEGYLFVGGSEFTPKDSEFPETEFIANMPTEEVFSMPKKTGVNGIVYSSKPLNYRGTLIDQFSLTFKNGEVVDYSAEIGYESLKSLIETDEGSRYLGEVALVPYDSPISKSGVLFYNTLYDENASCHLAIGKAYPVCIKGGENMTSEELEQHGVNESITHVDFMFGTKDLQITGVTHDGEEIVIFKDGNFAY
ncbi:aminopeptidase [Haloplasma contractile]|uniref:Leucyl aminopeptidase protein n=1 Tax=Haloplasma contractile SSD-17B TaxID=1033810 RepID=U2FPZ9_9MOLU|nr:aminopeptidase [Haloplasma contractile]ERJ13119.1 leucyl aminopeptidase protein [Haloplasma contractile SSD-17B]